MHCRRVLGLALALPVLFAAREAVAQPTAPEITHVGAATKNGIRGTDVVMTFDNETPPGCIFGGVHISGHNLWVTPGQVQRDVHVYVRVRGGAFQEMRHTGTNHTVSGSVEFLYMDWARHRCNEEGFKKPGVFEFVVDVRGVRSNVGELRVVPRPTVAPHIRSISGITQLTQPARPIRVVADNLDVSTTATVGGKPLAIREVNYGEGWLEGSLPPELQAAPGRYRIQLQSPAGPSLFAWIDVVGPPVMAATLPTIQRASSAIGVELVAVAFTGSAPTSARVYPELPPPREGAPQKGPGPGALTHPTPTSYAADVSVQGDSATLTLPAALFHARPSSVTIHLTNAAGTREAQARVTYVTVRPNLPRHEIVAPR